MRFIHHNNSAYVVVGPVFHKSLEVGGGRINEITKRLDLSVHFNMRGDHAGLRVYLGWRGLMVELNLTDGRHWDWTYDRFFRPGEEPGGCSKAYPH